VVEVFHEDLKMIFSLPMFVDFQATFTMFIILLCLTSELLISYIVPIFMYFITL